MRALQCTSTWYDHANQLSATGTSPALAIDARTGQNQLRDAMSAARARHVDGGDDATYTRRQRNNGGDPRMKVRGDHRAVRCGVQILDGAAGKSFAWEPTAVEPSPKRVAWASDVVAGASIRRSRKPADMSAI